LLSLCLSGRDRDNSLRSNNVWIQALFDVKIVKPVDRFPFARQHSRNRFGVKHRAVNACEALLPVKHKDVWLFAHIFDIGEKPGLEAEPVSSVFQEQYRPYRVVVADAGDKVPDSFIVPYPAPLKIRQLSCPISNPHHDFLQLRVV
jgi:hypothetical protein